MPRRQIHRHQMLDTECPGQYRVRRESKDLVVLPGHALLGCQFKKIRHEIAVKPVPVFEKLVEPVGRRCNDGDTSLERVDAMNRSVRSFEENIAESEDGKRFDLAGDLGLNPLCAFGFLNGR